MSRSKDTVERKRVVVNKVRYQSPSWGGKSFIRRASAFSQRSRYSGSVSNLCSCLHLAPRYVSKRRSNGEGNIRKRKDGIIKVRRQVARVDGQIVEAPLKTKNSYRTVTISQQAIEVLKQQKEKTNNEYVFPVAVPGRNFA